MSVIINNIVYFIGPLYTSSINSYNNISIINTSKNVFINALNVSCSNLFTNNCNTNNISTNNNFINIQKPFNFSSASFDINYNNPITTLISGVTYGTTTTLNMSKTKNYIINLSTYQYNDVSFGTYITSQNFVDNYVKLNLFTITGSTDYFIANINVYNFGVYLVYSKFRVYTTDSSKPSNVHPYISTALMVNYDSIPTSDQYITSYMYTNIPIVFNNTYQGNNEISLVNFRIIHINQHPSGKTFSKITLRINMISAAITDLKVDMLNSNLDINTNRFDFYAIKLS
jgi:hypothetical protein